MRLLRRLAVVSILVGCTAGDEAVEAPRPAAEVPPAPVPPQPSPAYRAGPVPDGGVLRGSVRVAPRAAPPPIVPTERDRDVCGARLADPSWVVDEENRIANVLVGLGDLRRGKPFEPSAGPTVLVIEGCRFVPHAAVAAVGSAVEIVDGDPLLHRIVATDREGRVAFRRVLPVAGVRLRERVTETGVLRLSCDLGHPWMSGYVAVVAHPYYDITDDEGTFRLEDVPAGSYRLELWHERLGAVAMPVTVTGGETTVVDVEIGRPAPIETAEREGELERP